jgi:uncharacterized Zn-binding protein involved in type VI secretion
MPAVSHNNHPTNVHSGYVPGMVIATAANFTAAGQMVARVGDSITTHACPGHSVPPHAGATVAAGAAKFTVGGKAIARIDDPTSCGAKIAMGVGNFTIG